MTIQKPRTRAREAFTLVELLVVVAIIVVLLALLLPGMDKAMSAVYKAKCLANLHGIGFADSMYLQDSKRTYASIWFWHGLVGKYGVYEPGSTTHPRVLNPGARPLNKYLGYTGSSQFAPAALPNPAPGVVPNTPTPDPTGAPFVPDPGEVPIAECPADLGDSFWGNANSYRDFGTSYIALPWTNHFRMENVYGNAGNTEYVTPSKKSTGIITPHAKVLVADWPVYGNRLWSNEQTRWHSNDLNKREMNTVFADGHAAFTEFELDRIDDGHRIGQPAAWYIRGDPSWHWW